MDALTEEHLELLQSRVADFFVGQRPVHELLLPILHRLHSLLDAILHTHKPLRRERSREYSTLDLSSGTNLHVEQKQKSL